MALNRRLLLSGVIVTVMMVAVFGDLGSGKIAQVFQNTAHVPAFGIIALLALHVLRIAGRAAQPRRRDYIIAFIVAVLLGVVVEVIQGILHRDAELQDVLHDALGALTALSLVYAFYFRQHSSRWSVAWLGCGIISLVLGTYPAAWASAAWLKRELQFPMLVQFDSRVDAFFLSPQSPTRIVAVPATIARQPGETALEVLLVSGDYPGVAIADLHGDWSSYRALMLDVANPTNAPVSFSLRVHDRWHDFSNGDRFSRSRLLTPHTRITYEIQLTDIESAPANRRMDMSQIASVILFSSPQPGAKIILKRLWLQ
jgi:VanZ family protein